MSVFFMIWMLIALLAIVAIPFLPLYYSSVRLWNRIPEKTQNKIKGWGMIAVGVLSILGYFAALFFIAIDFINGKMSFGEFISSSILYSFILFIFGLGPICIGIGWIKNPPKGKDKEVSITGSKLTDKVMTVFSYYFCLLISVGWLYWAYYIFQIAEKEYDGTIYYIASAAMVLGYIGLIIDTILERRKNVRKQIKSKSVLQKWRGFHDRM